MQHQIGINSVQYAQCSPTTNGYGYLLRLPYPNNTQDLMPHLQPTIGRTNTGGSLPAQGLQHLQQLDSVLGQGFQPQSEYNQPFPIPVPMTMASTMNGYYNSMFTQQSIAMSGGSMQELLRSVSMPSTNFQQCPTKKNFSSGFPHTSDVINDPYLNDHAKDYNNVEVGNEEVTESEDDEEYHQAGDESTDYIVDDEAENYVMPDLSDITKKIDKSTELEVVQLDNNGKLVGRKRRRFPKGYIVPDFRAPRDMGTIEKAMRNGPDSETNHIFEPKLGMVFDSRAEIYQFYNLYSWEVGFGVRFGCFARNRVNKMRTMQELVCEKGGR